MNNSTLSNIKSSNFRTIQLKRQTKKRNLKILYNYQHYSYVLKSISYLFSELEKIEQNQSFQTKIDEVILKCKMTDIIQKFLDICNPNFKNFKLRLEME
jgi:hypothetical protein